jgi:holo-ACP synthase
MKEELMQILKGREERANEQKKIISKTNSTLISFTVNTPGLEKNNDRIKNIFEKEIYEIKKSLKDKGLEIKYEKSNIGKVSGPEGFISVSEKAEVIKEMTVVIEENSPIGRLFDIDVLDLEGKPISRNTLNKEPRKCIVCGENAKHCSRSRKHPIEEVIDKFYKIYEYNLGGSNG